MENIILVDVGSANGLYPLFKKINIINNTICYTFEPEKSGFINNIDNNIINFNIGLYNKNIETTLYVTQKKECSSLLMPNKEILNKYNNPERFNIVHKKQIKCYRFNQKINIHHIDIIKLDTQGTEYEILEGLGDLIYNTKIIITETEFIELYKNQKLFDDLYNYLFKKNFIFIKFKRIVYFSKIKAFEINNLLDCKKIKNLTLLLCKKINIIDNIIDNIKLKFKLIALLITFNKENIQNYKKLVIVEKKIKSLIPLSIKNQHEELLNCDLSFSDAIFINKINNSDYILNYVK